MRARTRALGGSNGMLEPLGSIEDFFRKWKRGGKSLRLILGYHWVTGNPPLLSQCYNTFKTLTATIPTETSHLSTWFASWNFSAFSNEFRSFIFNSRYNLLPLNNRLNSYRPEVNPGCTFCRIIDNNNYPRDSYIHCFYECFTVKTWLTNVFSLMDLDIIMDSVDFRNLYWYGLYKCETLTVLRHKIFLLIFDQFRYTVFKNRLRKRMPSSSLFMEELLYNITWITKCNKKVFRTLHGMPELTRLAQAIG
jgi:hypothetical protein